MLIRNAVEAGHVDEAVRRVNELEPEVSILFFASTPCIPAKAPTPKITMFHAPLLRRKAMVIPKLYITDLI